MTLSKTGAAAAFVAVLVLAGCQSQRFSSLDSGGRVAEPLPPAPAGTVTNNQLPPPNAPGAMTDGSAFPQAPGTDQGAQPGTQVASVGGSALQKSALVGSWNVDSGGSRCQMFLTLTKYGSYSRGGTRGCAGNLSQLRGWDIAGSQLVLYDDSGNSIGQLAMTGNEQLSGQTTNGFPVSLSR